MKLISAVFIIILATLSAFYISEMYYFSQVKNNFDLNPNTEIWSHRGICNSEISDNTIPAFKEAISLGFTGIELDVRYLESVDRFVITHDKIKSGTTYNTLEKLFKDLNNPDIGYWIDFKNSYFFQTADSASIASLNRLKFLQEKFKLKKLYVETKNLIYADFLHNNGIKAIYWITVDISDFITFFNEKISLTSNKFDAISIEYSKITPGFLKTMEGIPIFTFTVNDKASIEKLFTHNNIQVILTDRVECNIEK